MSITTVKSSNLVYIANGKVWTDSLKLAESFGQRHADTLRKIEAILAETDKAFNQRNFALVNYLDAKGESRPVYNMTRDGFMHIALTFTGKKGNAFRVAVINAFGAMEQELMSLGARSAPKTTEDLLFEAVDIIRIKNQTIEAQVLVIEASKIGPEQIQKLENTIARKSKELASELKWGGPGPVMGICKKLVKARYAGARAGGTFKEIAVNDFALCIDFVEDLTSDLIQLGKEFPGKTDANLAALARTVEAFQN
ncbi:MAG: hypothetical protein EOP04_03180 [Proteobacteria bacterium]|nr:MAG: hypothetical protein EOP04_03180 [Pseudomonadota bacterium]